MSNELKMSKEIKKKLLDNDILNDQVLKNIKEYNKSNRPLKTEKEKDEELLRIYIGNNYEKIINDRFNLAAFLGNAIYLCYRKMMSYGLGLALIIIILNQLIQRNNLLLNIIITLIITLILSTISGLFINKIYIKDSKKRIKLIKEKYKDKDFTELKGICATAGGTSIDNIFLGVIGIVAMILIIVTVVSKTNI